jgi:hypothetical protein
MDQPYLVLLRKPSDDETDAPTVVRDD